MELKEHEKTLIKIYQEVKEMYVSDRSITRIESLINDAYWISQNHENLGGFHTQVRQTLEKELAALLKVKDKPKLRINAWNDVKKHFLLDFSQMSIRNFLK
jgi:hypothetical protein